MEFVTLKELHEELLKRPGFKEAYDALEPEYALRNAIIRARYEQGLTQAELARRMGTKQSAISRFERHGNPTIEFMQKLSRALGLTLKITVQ